MASRLPKSLYKYLSFSDRMVEQLYHRKVYFADPATFNDPLDCRPLVVEGNQTAEGLHRLLKLLILRRVEKEASTSLKRLKLRGEKLDIHISRLGNSEVENLLAGINYHITNPEILDRAEYLRYTLLGLIQNEVKEMHATGVLCLSEKADSPLMWSHYGQQHRGVCIEYDVSGLVGNSIQQVVYGGSRQISADCLLSWIEDANEAAQREVERTSLLTKSRDWRYEKEWRLLGHIGLERSPAPIKSVTFGMNCPAAITDSTMSMLGGEQAAVKFWKIIEPSSDFKLKRKRIHFDGSMLPAQDDYIFESLDNLLEL